MQKLKLLFVEDEFDIREIVAISLGLDLAIDVESFASGAAALEAFTLSRKTVHYALLDVHLPDMSGFELHEALRALPGMADLKSVLITADAKVIQSDDTAMAGVVGVIAKPFDPLTLARDVRELLGL